MKKKILTLFVVFILLGFSAVAVAAETGTVTITGGSLSLTAADVALSAVTLDGTDQTSTSASGSNTWTAVDARGTGVGWNVTIEATDFSDGGSNTIDISAADQKFQIQLTSGNISTTAGNGAPSTQAASLTDIPTTGGTALKFASAAVGDGMGTYVLNPNFSLMVPAETYAGTYTSTITLTAVSGP